MKIYDLSCDGDQLNVVPDETFINIAERNIDKYNIKTLFYDASKAPPDLLSYDSLYHGLLRAHKFSNIGTVSNSLTRLWNSDKPDYESAARIAAYNNRVNNIALLYGNI